MRDLTGGHEAPVTKDFMDPCPIYLRAFSWLRSSVSSCVGRFWSDGLGNAYVAETSDSAKEMVSVGNRISD